MKLIFVIFWTLLAINCFGQCAVATMVSEADHLYNNVKDGIDPKKKYEDNNLISLLRVDSAKSKGSSYFLTVLLRNASNRNQRTAITLEFVGQEKIMLNEDKIELSIVDFGFGFEESEIFYPLDKHAFDKISKMDLVKIKIEDTDTILIVAPEKNLLRRLTKCLQ